MTVTKPIKTQKVEISKNKQSDEEKIVIQQAKVELTSAKTQKVEISSPKTQKVEISMNKQSDEEKIVNQQTKVELPSANAQKVELTVNKPPKAEISVTQSQQEEKFTIHQYKKEEVPEIDRNQVLDSSVFNANEKIEVIEIIKDEKVLKVAMMKVRKEDLQHFVNINEKYQSLNHPNILKTHGILFGNEIFPSSILLEYCPLNLEQAIKRKKLSKVQMTYLIYQIAEGLRYLHFKKIMHHNLKPANILISESGLVKICDLDVQKNDQDDSQKFSAQEKNDDGKYDEKIDVYSFGIIAYFILSGGEFPENEISKTRFSVLAKHLFEACWNTDPKIRPKFDVICNILEKNKFNLALLSQQEIQEVTELVKKYKKQIPAGSQ